MASTLPEIPAPVSTAPREGRIAERTDILCLEQLVARGRLFYAFVPCSLLMAYLAAKEGELVCALVWLATTIARDIYAHFQLKRLMQPPFAPTAAVVNEISLAFILAGMLVVALLPIFFARSNNTVLLLVLALVGIHISGAREQAGGILRVWMGYGVVTFGAVIAGGLWRGGSVGLATAGVMAALFPVTVFVIRARRREMLNLVGLIDDNEALSRDLSGERDRAQAERDRAEAANASKTRFFTAASHDLRQPLHALSINATTLDLVARRSGDVLLNELSRGIGSALRQSSSLLDGLLDISRLDAQAVKLRMAAYPVVELLVAVRDEYAALASQQGLTLVVSADEKQGVGGLWVNTDVDQLLRILGNLVDNALKFTPSGSITLSAQSVGVKDGGAGQVQVRVTDTGPGISKAEQERVFEEFYQIGNQSRDRAQGLGLGLAIVKRTAKLLGIGIELVSEPGSGTSFVLSLPGANPVVAQCSDIEKTPREDCNLRGSTISRSVLLIDDESEVRSSLCTYLHHIGWSAQGAAGGAEAVQVLRQGFSPDILIVDFRLRDETGLDVIRRLQSYCPQVPALLVTGDTASQTLLESSGLVAGVLHKPVDGDALLRAMTQVLGLVRPPG